MEQPGELSLVVRSDLSGRESEWDAIVARMPLPSPFLRSWWLEQVARGQVVYLLVQEGETLVGGLPLTVDRRLGVPRYRFIGQGVLCPDHLDIVADPDREDEVAPILGAWFTRPGQRLLDLSGIAENSLLVRSWPGQTSLVDVAPFQELPSDPETYFGSFSRNFRSTVRRAEKRLEAAGLTHRRVGPDTLSAALDDFRSIQESRPDRQRLVAELGALFPAVVAGVASGEVRVDVWESPAAVAAVSVAFVTAGRLSLYQLARSMDPAHNGVGNAANHLLIRQAIQDGCHEVDMLRGAEGYKASFADSRRDVLAFRAAHGTVAQAVLRLIGVATRARPRVGRTLRRWRRSD